MPEPKLSLITINSGRDAHLDNLLRGLARGEELPAETIVVTPQGERAPAAPAGLRVRHLTLPPATDGRGFRVGVARNHGAERARGELLVFLDVDCVPGPTYVRDLRRCLRSAGGLVMATPHYLDRPLPPDWTFAVLAHRSRPHPHRPAPRPGLTPQPDYALFWSLCFGMRRADWDRLGGFDGAYYGYGAEDTDLGFRARTVGLPFSLTDSPVFHQQHPVHRPPLHQFASIVDNCRHFYGKWGVWPMGNWLAAFRELGLVEWAGPQGPCLRVIAPPPPELVADSRVADAAWA